MQQAMAEKLLNWLLRGDALTPPSNWYWGLDVSLSGSTYAEPTYTGYARVAVARSTAKWVSATGAGQIVSAADVAWPALPGGYTAGELVRRVFISDSATSSGETLLDYVPLANGVTLVASGTPTIASGTAVLDV